MNNQALYYALFSILLILAVGTAMPSLNLLSGEFSAVALLLVALSSGLSALPAPIQVCTDFEKP